MGSIFSPPKPPEPKPIPPPDTDKAVKEEIRKEREKRRRRLGFQSTILTQNFNNSGNSLLGQ